MWKWLVPFESNSLRSTKSAEVVTKELLSVVQLQRHWLLAVLLGPSGQLVGDFSGNRFTLTRKRIVGKNSYFPLARVTVRDAEGGAILEIHYSSPMFYLLVALVFGAALMAVQHHHWDAAVLILLFWLVGHAVCSVAYQMDKEKIDAEIRQTIL
jgi:hypothetical protein